MQIWGIIYLATTKIICLELLLLKRTISTKLGRKHARGMWIKICSNKGVAPFGAQ